MGLFERLHQQGNTIILVTHEHDIAERAHRVITIRDGEGNVMLTINNFANSERMSS